MHCWSRNWHLYAVPQYQEEKKWALVPLAIQPETKIPLTRLLMPFASMLLSASLESLQAEGPQTSRALSSAFRRGSCRVEHLGSRSPGGTERSLRLVAQPTAALRFPPESRSAHPSTSTRQFWHTKICVWPISYTVENCGGENSMRGLQVRVAITPLRSHLSFSGQGVQLSDLGCPLSQAYSKANATPVRIMSPYRTLKWLKRHRLTLT